MLNDVARNAAYCAAITKAVRAICDLHGRCVVLDIGGGTGLLSMYAVRAGADEVYCCETSVALAEIALECVERNGMSEQIRILTKHSTELLLDVDLPPVDLIVTELVDSGLLGEHIVHVLADAMRLLKVGGRVIPHSATISGKLISSESIARIRQYRNEYMQVRVDECYTCEELGDLIHVQLTDAVEVVDTVSFRELAEETFLKIHRVPILASGRMDAFAYWFELHLEAGGVGVSTRPGRSDCGWDQALVFLNGGPVREGDELTMQLTLSATGLHCDCEQAEPDTREISLGEGDISALHDESYYRLIRFGLATNTNCALLELTSRWRSVALEDAYSRIREGSLVVVPSSECRDHLRRLASGIEQFSVESGSLAELLSGEGCWLEQLRAWADLAIISDIVESSGLVRQQILADIGLALAARPVARTRVLPAILIVHAVLVECPALIAHHRVYAASTLGINVEPMNRFGSRRVCELDLLAGKYRFLSIPVEVLCFPLERLRAAIETGSDIAAKGECIVPVSSPGIAHMIGYWFSLRLDDAREVYTGPDSSTHWRQAGALLETPFTIGTSDSNTLRFDTILSLAYGVDIELMTVP
jgi:predicted RNA methylase